MLPGISPIAQFTVTSLRYQPLLPDTPATAASIAGGVRSILMNSLSNVLVFPARSTTTTDAYRPSPSPVMIIGLGRLVDATPDSESSAVKGMLTSPLYHPEEPASGDGSPNRIVGGTVSRRM